MTRNSSDFRTPQEVINGWYVETNMDSNNKFINLKKLLTLFEMEDELFVKYSSETESSSDSNRFNIRKKYWKQLLPLLNNTDLFRNVNASKDHWLSSGAGTGGVSYTFVVTKTYARIELTISTSSKETNKIYYKNLLRNKEQIEQIFGGELVWEELPENKMSRIKIEEQGVTLYNDNDWERMNSFLISNLPKFEKALEPFIKKLR
jgi:nicotinamide mononucleotide adenylyltransferase